MINVISKYILESAVNNRPNIKNHVEKLAEVDEETKWEAYTSFLSDRLATFLIQSAQRGYNSLQIILTKSEPSTWNENELCNSVKYNWKEALQHFEQLAKAYARRGTGFNVRDYRTYSPKYWKAAQFTIDFTIPED